MRRSMFAAGLLPLGAAVGIAMTPAAAQANGFCGNNPDPSHACGIAFGNNYSGNLSTINEKDFYTFKTTTANTAVHIVLKDTEAPGCTNGGVYPFCGSVEVAVVNASGEVQDMSASTYPDNNKMVSASLDYTVPVAGTYYAVVDGQLGQPDSSNKTPTPYAFSFTSSPPVGAPSTSSCSTQRKAVATATQRLKHATSLEKKHRSLAHRRLIAKDKGLLAAARSRLRQCTG